MFVKNIFIKTFVLLIGSIPFSESLVSRTIPNHLIDCYKHEGVHTYAPHNVQLLVELINKIEQNNNNYNVRTLSASLIHSLKIDGIERAPNIVESDLVIPYRASAFQFIKFSFLLDLLVPGEDLINIRDGLTTAELCTLHFLISSTVDPWERGDEVEVCPLNMEGNRPEDSYSHKHIFTYVLNRTNGESSYSRCPIEHGVIQSHWGDISTGTVISGISAALEPQDVKLRDLLKHQLEFEDEVDIVNIKPSEFSEKLVQDFRKEMKDVLMQSENVISNILAATITGDIAELAIRQGILYGPDSTLYNLGLPGIWDDSILPRSLYFLSSIPNQWEITNAEILAGIDGFIIANYIKEWTSTLERIRLSQIIEMYYSSYGVAFNHNVRACNRRQNMMKLYKSNDIYNQTLNLVNALWLRLSTVYVTPTEIEIISRAAVKSFDDYWPRLVDSLPSCDVHGDTNPMDVILTTDGSWTQYKVAQLVSILSETLDVSSHGSTMGLMHMSSGEWLASPSHSILEIFDTFANSTETWPNRLDLPSVLTSVLVYLQNKTVHESEIYDVVGLPLVVILVIPATKLTQYDLDRSHTIMQSIRDNYIDVYFVYLTPDKSGFLQLALGYSKYADLLIETESTNVKEVAEIIRKNFIEKPLPKRLIAPPCGLDKVSSIRYEDYINMGQKTMYKIHQKYLDGVPVVKVQFRGTDQGEVSVCISRQHSESSAVSCKIITGQYDATFQINHPCTDIKICDPIYFFVKSRSTLIKCADKDCRYPDQIRYIIQHEGLRCIGSDKSNYGYSVSDRKTLINIFILQTIMYLLVFLTG